MHLVYPAIFHREEDSYWVEFPDLEGCQSFGDTLDETVLNAKEALEGYAMTLLEQGSKLPSPSDICTIAYHNEAGKIFTSLVECNLSNNMTKCRAVKKTLTIPSWLNDMAIKEGINFSNVLQNALLAKLQLGEK